MKERLFHIADTLKSAYIDYVLKTFDKDVIIGHEVMYGSCGKLADLVLLSNGNTYAIEVKSDSDSLSRIEGQIAEYQKQFNYVIVVCGEKHKKKLQQQLPKGVGLYQVQSDSSVKVVLRPRKNPHLDKEEMLFSVRISYLTKQADFPTDHIGTDTIRHIFTKKSTSFVQEMLYEYWREKMAPAFESFLSGRGNQTIPSDLSNFSTYRVLRPIV